MIPVLPIGRDVPAGNAGSSPSRESVAGLSGGTATQERAAPQSGRGSFADSPSRPSSHLSIVDGLGKGQTMSKTGVIAVRCGTCGQLGYDWRDNTCLDHQEETE